MSEPAKNSRNRTIKRIVNKSVGLNGASFKDAAEWDVKQQLSLSPQERLRAAKVLKDRAFPKNAPDVRACREK